MTIPITSVTPSALLPVTNIHPHGHHRGGSSLNTLFDPGSSTDTTDLTGATSTSATASGAGSTDAAPDGTTKGLFSTILNSLEGVIGASTGISLGSILNTKA